MHNKLNNTHLALMHFSWAMDLDPKGANSQIKDALDPALNRAAQEENNATAAASAASTTTTPNNNTGETGQPGEMMQTGEKY